MPGDIGPDDWLRQWQRAATGRHGFWRSARPPAHFRTAGDERALTDPLTDSAALLIGIVEAALPAPARPRVVDLGAGEGALLAALARRRPAWGLAGVDVRDAPADLPPHAEWHVAIRDVVAGRWTDREGRSVDPASWVGPGPTVLVAHEWLDDLPCPVAQRVGGGWRLLGPTGPLGPGDPGTVTWLDRWSPDAEVAEAGTTRDAAWLDAARSLSGCTGLLVAIDYGHLRADRPTGGTLAGYRDGRRVAPVPDGSTNLTAHVAVDALAAAVEALPGVHRLRLARRRNLFAEIWTDIRSPAPAPDPLAALVAANRRRLLTDPAVWGDQWWVVHAVGAQAPHRAAHQRPH